MAKYQCSHGFEPKLLSVTLGGISYKNTASIMLSGIIDQLKFCRDQRFTGKLCASSLRGDTVDDLEGHCWNIYFYRGRLIGDGAGIQPLRRFRRQFSEQRISLPIEIENDILKSLRTNNLNFDIIANLLTDRHLDQEQAQHILNGSLTEVLFDILHYEAISQTFNTPQLSYILEKDAEKKVQLPGVLLKPETVWAKALIDFKLWNTNGLLRYSPHLLPKIANLKILQEILPAKSLEKTISLLEDNRTLRDLAVKLDEDIVVLTKSLINLSKKNGLTLQRTIDIDLIEKRLGTAIDDETVSQFLVHGSGALTAFSKKLIVHLTQNRADISVVQNFVQEAGHDYLNLQEPTQALITFLKCSPDLILMDYAARGINTQDLCDRLRRTSKFKTTPIVMLGNKNESVMERLRNYSIDQVAKPLNQQKIFSMINKHIALVG
jgi:two-component system, chemotaxis family, response regulator PixG